MAHPDLANPALTVALALAAGVVAQVLARHLRIPGIVLLLGAGVLLGPELADVVRPSTVGPAMQHLVGFAIAVILFEGGLSLDVRRLRREGTVIRRLVTLGAVLTGAGGALAAGLLMGWAPRQSILFGVLVIVTGPTVVTPIVRRIGLTRNLRTVLEAEGVFIDAVGALIAVVTLEALVEPSASALVHGAQSLGLRLGFGLVAGLAGGVVIAGLLRFRWAVPEGLGNVLTLALVLALFQASNAFLPESGILAVIVAGVVVGNARIAVQRELAEFKEQLTVMLVGMLFVLLAADVRLYRVFDLGVPGLLTVAALMLVVRPVTVLACTAGSGMSLREKAFLAWLAPRGIVAAAVASIFAQSMRAAGLEGGEELRALVFLVIGATVVLQGLSAGIVATLLGVRRRMDDGWVILGAGALARTLGQALRDAGEEVVFLDPDPTSVRATQEAGFHTLYGAPLEERALRRTEPEARRGYVALALAEGVNLLVARKLKDELKVRRVLVGLDRGNASVQPSHVAAAGCQTLFAGERDLAGWEARCAAGAVVVERWKAGPGAKLPSEPADLTALELALVPIVLVRGSDASPAAEGVAPRPGDEVRWLVARDRLGDAEAWLGAGGWQRVATGAGEGAAASA
ncbi:MAG: sodium:proton antiporter [Anaeromyxobacter sp.]